MCEDTGFLQVVSEQVDRGGGGADGREKMTAMGDSNLLRLRLADQQAGEGKDVG